MSSRTKVMNGNANQTSGGLNAGDLKYNSKNRIVSAVKSDNARSGPLAVWRKVCADYLQGGEFTNITAVLVVKIIFMAASNFFPGYY